VGSPGSPTRALDGLTAQIANSASNLDGDFFKKLGGGGSATLLEGDDDNTSDNARDKRNRKTKGGLRKKGDDDSNVAIRQPGTPIRSATGAEGGGAL